MTMIMTNTSNGEKLIIAGDGTGEILTVDKVNRKGKGQDSFMVHILPVTRTRKTQEY